MLFFKQYKNKIIKAMILLFLIIMLIFSDSAFRGASSGLLLWFHNVLPALLPFIIVSNLIIRLNISKQISKVFYPILGRLLGISLEGCYPIVIGFLSGLPMGAKASSDLTEEHHISRKEGQFLLTMCNNASPMFIIGYIAITQLKLPSVRFSLLAIIYGSSILGAVLYRFIYNKLFSSDHKSQQKLSEMNNQKPISNRFTFGLLDSSIMNGFDIITKIGGYIILFSIMAQIMKEIGPSIDLLKAILTGILEITTGISQICNMDLNIKIKIVLISVLTSFGGLSAIAQTKSVIQGSRLSILSYFFVKLISAAIAFVLSMIYVTLIPIQ